MLVATRRSVYMVSHQEGLFRLIKVAQGQWPGSGILGPGDPTPEVGAEFVGASLSLRLGRPLILADGNGVIVVRSTPITLIEM